MNGKAIELKDLNLEPESYKLFLRFFFLFSRLEAVWKSDPDLYNWKKQHPKFKAISQRIKDRNGSADKIISTCDNVRYLDEEPPKVQVEPNKWDDYTPPSYCDNDKLMILLDKVRVVRNNVFHGGKWTSLPIDLDRNIRLVSGAVVVMEQILACNSDWRDKMQLI